MFKVQLRRASPDFDEVLDEGEFPNVDAAYDAADEVGCKLVNLNKPDIVVILNCKDVFIHFDGSRDAKLAFFHAVMKKG